MIIKNLKKFFFDTYFHSNGEKGFVFIDNGLVIR